MSKLSDMHKINVTATSHDPSAVEIRLVEFCHALGLEMGQAGELKRYPGSRHWHLKRRKASGTLEVTVWPEAAQVWVSYHTNRAAPWVQEAAPQLAAVLQERLSAPPSL